MDLKKEKWKITAAVAYLRAGHNDTLLREYAEAYKHGADILDDYLKSLGEG